jgi:Na+/melibiose symporter-like transporter
VLKLGIFVGPITAIPGIVAIFVYARYAITRERHLEIQRELAQRRSPVEASGQPSERAPHPVHA